VDGRRPGVRAGRILLCGPVGPTGRAADQEETLPPEPAAPAGLSQAEVDGRAQALLGVLAGPAAVLRDDQLAAVRALVVERRRVVVVKRTGWGKSAVYFLATRLLRDAGAGPTLLVSPLLSLMRDQIAKAEGIGIRAATINSTNVEDWRQVEAELAAGRVDLLLISPERLNSPSFRDQVLPDLCGRIGLLVVDEAHCISDWGHDFRPDYRRLLRVLDDLGQDVPVLACTATANERVMADVAEQLGAEPRLFRGALDRDSLVLSVLHLPAQAERLAWLAQHLPGLPGSGIVYCLTVGDAERVAAWLGANGIDARAYSGRTDPEERLAVEDALRANRVKVVAATSALGMGFDKPDLAFVVHFQSPDSPVTYYQQIGRAGRALDRAEVVLLCGAEDRAIWEWFATTAFPPREQVAAVLGALEAAGGPLSTALLEEVANLSRSRLELMLKVLDVDGAVRRVARGWERTDAPWSYDADRHARVAAARSAEQRAMLAYAGTGGCLMAFLRAQLDDQDAAPCGRCANCTGRGPSPGVDPGLPAEAARFLAGQDLTLAPRLAWPQGVPGLRGRIPEGLRVEPGRALATLGGPGWGPVVRELLAADGPVPDEVLDAVVRVLARWAWRERPAWVTFVPSRCHPRLVEDLAARIADVGRLPLHPVLGRTRDGPPQLEMANSAHQLRNVHGAFAVTASVPSGPVLLVDDAADSKWTLTAVGALLLEAGAGAVHPLVLLRRGPD
jgi:ATP-dependent DNA helicase RecQ